MENLKPTLANSPPLTPITFLKRAADAYSGYPSIIYNSKTYTWSETYDRCLQGASAISKLGIGRNDVVSVVSPNVPAAYELHFTVPMAGTVLNNISTQIDHPQIIAKLLQQSKSKLIFVHKRFSSQILEAVSLLPSDQAPSLVFIKDEEDCNKENDDSTTPSNYYGEYEEFIGTRDSKFNWVRPESEWDPIVLNYVWGMTSLPNGVVHSHRSCYLKALDSLLNVKIPESPVYLWTLPMSYANGWSFTWGMAAIGGTNIFPPKVDPANIYKLINHHQVTHMSGTSVVLNMLAKESSGDVDSLANKPVHFLVAADYLDRSADSVSKVEKIGFKVTRRHVLTETMGLMPDALGVVDDDIFSWSTGKPDEFGQIVLRGNSVMLGYLNDTEATNKRIGEDGLFRTKTLGKRDGNGKISIKDHVMDNTLIYNCEVLTRKIVEDVLDQLDHPGIIETSLELNADKDILYARVEVKPGLEHKDHQNIEQQIIELCKDNLCSFMVPKHVQIIKGAF